MTRSLKSYLPSSYITPELPSRLDKIRMIASKELWRITVLPASENYRLKKATGVTDDYWFNTTGAAFYCFCKKGYPKTDWHSVLQENRRNQNDAVAVVGAGKKPRGNVYRLGELRHHMVGNKIFYTKTDIDKWLTGFSSPIIQ